MSRSPTEGARETVIDVRHLTKRFGDRAVVDDVSLQVRRGEVVGFLGPNGSGKTTTIRLICGLLRLDGGEGRVLGFDLRTESRAIKAEVGYMTQRFSLYEDLSIEENLNLVAGLYRLPDPRGAVADTLASLGLTSRRRQLSGSLSGGWKQRLALAACIMHQPKLLLLDEPTAGVDPKARREFWDEIHRLTGEGMTVLVSTHYMDEAERCHRINYIAYGRLIAEGTVEDVVARAGLTTRHVTGPGLEAVARRLRASPGVDQVAAFGTSLHVVGRDAAALDAALAGIERDGVRAAPAETSLEDVFIQFMGASEDNMA
jgi:ABC-2 type transport system ATP-binding protein